MRVLIYAHTGGWEAKDYEKVFDLASCPQVGDRIQLGPDDPLVEIRLVVWPIHLTNYPLVALHLYGRADDKSWEPSLDKLGFAPARAATKKVVH